MPQEQLKRTKVNQGKKLVVKISYKQPKIITEIKQ